MIFSDSLQIDETPAPLADTGRARDLKTTEMLALWTIRTWVWSVHEHGHAGHLYKEGLEKAACMDAAEPVSSLMHVVGASALRTIEIHKSGCSCVCPDEKRFLHALAAQQTGHALEAFDVLSVLLPGLAVPLALGHADAVATSFARAGLFFPDRAWGLDELALNERLRAPRSHNTCVRYMLH